MDQQQTSDPRFTVEEFNQQIIGFRGLLSSKDFWNLPDEKHEAACKALIFAYMWLEDKTSPAQVTRCAEVLEATLGEYENRKTMILAQPPKPT